MPRNIEIKVRVEDLNALTVKVAAIADQGPIEIIQDDTFFACDTGRLKLRTFSQWEGELIFYRRNNQQGPKQSFYVRSPTSAPETMREALSLAYGQTGRVHKHRTLFMVGRTRVHLDRVSGLGSFLELEVVLREHEHLEAGVREAREMMAQPTQLVSKLTEAIDEAFERRTVVSFAASLINAEGVRQQFEMCVVPAIENERVVGGTLRATDVTEHQELERQIIDGASQERRRLSNEVHEGVSQQLAGVLLLLGNAASAVQRGLPNAVTLIEEISRYVQEAIYAMREIARGLAPVKIGMDSLTLALERYVADASRQLRVVIDCDCRLEGVVLSDLAADHLFSICREAVTNAALHGRCSRTSICVQIVDSTLRLSINDDGTGMPGTDSRSPGLAMKMIAYRMRLLGGDCNVTYAHGSGSCVIASVPLSRVVADRRD